MADERPCVQTFLRHKSFSSDLDFKRRRSCNRERAIHDHKWHDQSDAVLSVEEVVSGVSRPDFPHSPSGTSLTLAFSVAGHRATFTTCPFHISLTFGRPCFADELSGSPPAPPSTAPGYALYRPY